MLKRVLPRACVVCITATLSPAIVLGGSPGSARVNAAAGRVKVKSSLAPLPGRRSALGSAIDLGKAVEAGISADVLTLALQATSCAARVGDLGAPPPTLTVIDYSRPSVEPRLWTFDLRTGDLLFKELVAHGRNTGDNLAKHFSNDMDSRQSSIGLFVTDEPYFGSNGYSLRLDGLDVGFNNRARDRAIVMHGAPYVSAEIAARQGRIGRSWGCPALRTAVAAKVIDRIRGGSVIFSYYPDQDWLATSRFLKGCAASS